MKRKEPSTLDIGKVYLEENGAGRIYVPRTIMEAAGFNHRDILKLSVEGAEGEGAKRLVVSRLADL